jgi:hypothetical protein
MGEKERVRGNSTQRGNQPAALSWARTRVDHPGRTETIHATKAPTKRSRPPATRPPGAHGPIRRQANEPCAPPGTTHSRPAPEGRLLCRAPDRPPLRWQFSHYQGATDHNDQTIQTHHWRLYGSPRAPCGRQHRNRETHRTQRTVLVSWIHRTHVRRRWQQNHMPRQPRGQLPLQDHIEGQRATNWSYHRSHSSHRRLQRRQGLDAKRRRKTSRRGRVKHNAMAHLIHQF